MESNSESKTNFAPLTIYKASAGSGKTYTLAYRYIKMLLGEKREDGSYRLSRRNDKRAHSHILAITFTNKATAEMKSRIIKELDRLGYEPQDGEKDTPYAADLIKEFGCTRQALAAKARYALKALLLDYGAFNISTIDAFFQTILRCFAREIDRQGDFKLELDTDFVLSSALSMMFDDVNDNKSEGTKSINEWLRIIATQNMEQGQDFNPYNRSGVLYRQIIGLLAKIFDEDFDARADKLEAYLSDPSKLKRFQKRLYELINISLDEEAELAKEFISQLDVEGFSADNDITRNLAGLLEKSIEHESDDIFDRYYKNPPAKYIENLSNKDYSSGLFKKGVEPSAVATLYLDNWFKYTHDAVLRRAVYRELLAEIKPLRAIGFIKDYISQYRLDNNMILLADTNTLLKSIISESDAPFIYERVGVELRHFLIDEFQDTSTLQWNNIRPLLANSLASGDDSLIIGDVKQSIYRWRGGDSSLLQTRVHNYCFPHESVEEGTKPGQNSNYRSSHLLVRFNNTLFRRLSDKRTVGGYNGIEQSLPKSTADIPGHVLVRNFSKEKFVSAIKSCGLSLDDLMVVMGGSIRQAALFMLGRTIMQQHKRGYMWKDIAILVRRRSDAVEIAEYLMGNFPEIKLVSEEALLVRNSSAVKLIVSILEMMDQSLFGEASTEQSASPETAGEDPHDRNRDKRRATMVIDRFEYFLAHGTPENITPTQALMKALDEQDDAAENNEDEPSAKLSDDLETLRHLAPANLPALIEAIIMLKVPQNIRQAQVAYLTAFLDVVTEYSTNFNPTVHSFLDFWRQNEYKITISAGSNTDAVSIMTVHKAKGLEWPCVHIPLMNWDLEGRCESAWYRLDDLNEVDEDIRPPIMYITPTKYFAESASPFAKDVLARITLNTADNLNLLYVAFTRAVNELHVTMLDDTRDTSRLAMSDIISAMQAPINDVDDDKYINLHKFYDPATGCLEIGKDTTPIAKKAEATKPLRQTQPSPIPAPPIDVAFTSLNACVTQVEDMVVNPAEGNDPNIGNNVPTDMLDDEASQEAARRGSALHAILADMYTLADLDEALKRNSVHLSEREVHNYRFILSQAFRMANDAGGYADLWFSPDAPRILNEQPIYLPDRNESYRPDRIVWTTNGTIDIIDYKFTGEVKDAHKEQVKRYAGMLADMGYTDIRAFIWRPEAAEIVPVC